MNEKTPRNKGESPRTPDSSYTEGRMGTGKNAGVRNADGGVQRRDEGKFGKRGFGYPDPDIRVGARGAMQQNIGESICLQPGNDCSE